MTFFTSLAIVGYYFAHKLIYDFALQDHQRMIGFLSANIEANLQQHLQELNELAQHKDIANLNRTKAVSEIENYLGFANLYTSIHLYAKNGDLLLAVKRDSMPEYKPKKNIHEQADKSLAHLLDQVLKENKSLISDISRARSGLLYQVYAVPVKNKAGEVTSVIMGGFSPVVTNFDFLTEGLEFDDKNFVSLYAKQVQVLAVSGGDQITQEVENISAEAALVNAGSKEITEIKHKDFIVLAKYLPTLRYWLVYGLNRSVLRAKEEVVLHYLFLLFCVCSLFCFAFSNFLGRRISKPFELLVNGFKQLHLGAFEYRINYNKKDEMGYLCHLFNRQMDKIQKDKTLGEFWTNEEELEKIKNGENI